MTRSDEKLDEVVHRGKDREWLDQLRINRKQWIRRNISISAIITVLALIAAFLLNDGPRRSGLMDAMGVTCGEYVTDYGPVQEEIFESWGDHLITLDTVATQRSAEGGEFDSEVFAEDVAQVAQELDAEPIHGLFRGWTQPSWTVSAAPVGGQLLIGHHEKLWTITERVSLADVETGDIRWSANLEHPTQDEWQEPTQVLSGVGVAGSTVILQTPTVSEDTDVLIFDVGSEGGMECIRLEGDVDTVEVLHDEPRIWPAVMNLNQRRISETGFLVLHGQDEELGSPHRTSRVIVDTLEVEPQSQFAEVYPPDPQFTAVEEDEIDVGGGFGELQGGSVQPLGEEYYLVTWESGYIILEG